MHFQTRTADPLRLPDENSSDARDTGGRVRLASLVFGIAFWHLGRRVDWQPLLGGEQEAVTEDLAIVVDATWSGEPAGTVRTRRLETADPASIDSSSARLNSRASTHGLGLDDVLRLARSLGSAPARVVLVGIEGSDFGLGAELSPSVAAAVQEAAYAVLELIKEAHQCA